MAEGSNSDRTIVLGAVAPELAPSRLHHNALPVGTLLGEFEIVDLVGEGGFGIVYLAQDHSLQRKVALKEYMPALLAARGHDAAVSVRSERQRETFDAGLRSFVNEARMLAQFDHPALVKVYRFWEANGTAYMVMPYYNGQTLEEALKRRGDAPGEAWIRATLSPVMDALEVLHEDRVYHRDISPDNIMLLAGDRPVLLDFGAARRVISDMTHALTVILKPGYAPIEQYADMPGMKQGPWTDVYALAAVMYFMILGRKPPPAVSRLMQDGYEPLVRSEAAGRYSAQLLQGLDRCLSVKAPDRPPSIAAMREALGFTTTAGVAAPLPPDKAVGRMPAASIATDPPARSGPPAAAADDASSDPAATARLAVEVPRPGVEASPPSVEAPFSARDPATWVPARNARVPLIAAGAVVLAVVIGGYAYHRFTRSTAATTPSASISPPAAPVAAAPAVVEVPRPAVSAPPAAPAVTPIAGLKAAIDAALAAADPRLAVMLEAPASLPAGHDLKVVVHSKADGLLYLFVWDEGTNRIYRLSPDQKVGGNAIKADGSVTVTHRDAASPAAGVPTGGWRVVSLLSERPRDFPAAPFGRDGDRLVADRSALESGLAVNGLSSLLGTPQCAAGESCPDHFAVSVASVAREPSPPQSAGKRARATKAASSSPPAAGSAGRKAPDSEREYMKRLDKDLDKLLGK